MDCIPRIFARTTPTARRVLVTHHPLVELPWGKAGGPLRAAGVSVASVNPIAPTMEDVFVQLVQRETAR